MARRGPVGQVGKPRLGPNNDGMLAHRDRVWPVAAHSSDADFVRLRLAQPRPAHLREPPAKSLRSRSSSPRGLSAATRLSFEVQPRAKLGRWKEQLDRLFLLQPSFKLSTPVPRTSPRRGLPSRAPLSF